MLIDSHCHLDRVDLTPYNGDFSALIAATREAGVTQCICVSIDLEQYPQMRALIDPYPEVMVSVGVHPNEREHREPEQGELEQLAKDARVVAIGETGLDYHYHQGDLSWQQARFRQHIRAARRCAKPLIIHSRDAREDTIRILREEQAAEVGGVLHCFTEHWPMAQAALELGFYVSFSGIITFNSAQALREVAQQVPLDRLLIETDAPYLAPVPHRGKPNEPRYLDKIAAKLAELHGMEMTELAAIVQTNTQRLFNALA